MSVAPAPQEQTPPYAPSYPAQPALDQTIEEFQRSHFGGINKRHHQLFHDKEHTILDVLQDELVERQAVDERINLTELERERLAFTSANAKRKLNTGFWIFGSGEQHDMPPEFNNPDLCSPFIIKILSIMVIREVIRGLVVSIILLNKSFHDTFYRNVIAVVPLVVMLVIYLFVLILTHNQKLVLKIRKYHFHAIIFFISEIVLGIVLLFIALLFEYAIVIWTSTLDIFDDYDEAVRSDRHYWTKLRLTPPVYLIIFDLQVCINVVCALLLQTFTPIHIGAHELYRIMMYLTVLTLAMSYFAILTSSYGLISIWDGLQPILGSFGGLGKSWIFVYKVVRLMNGRVVALESLGWNDVFYAAFVLF